MPAFVKFVNGKLYGGGRALSTDLGTSEVLSSGTSVSVQGALPAVWYGPSLGASAGLTNRTQTLDRAYAMPFYSEGATYDRIAVQQNSGSTAGEVARLGIYADSGSGYPGALLLDAGSVAIVTSGVKSITISQALTKGLWWLVCSHQVTVTNVLIGYTPVSNGGPQTVLPASLTAAPSTFIATSFMSFIQDSVSGALPSNWTATPAASTDAVYVALRKA